MCAARPKFGQVYFTLKVQDFNHTALFKAMQAADPAAAEGFRRIFYQKRGGNDRDSREFAEVIIRFAATCDPLLHCDFFENRAGRFVNLYGKFRTKNEDTEVPKLQSILAKIVRKYRRYPHQDAPEIKVNYGRGPPNP